MPRPLTCYTTPAATPPLWTANAATGSYAVNGAEFVSGPAPPGAGYLGTGDPGTLVYSYGAGGSQTDWQGLTSADPVLGAFCLPITALFASPFYLSCTVAVCSTVGGSVRLTATLKADGSIVKQAVTPLGPANIWQTTSAAWAVPVGADNLARLAVEFQRPSTGAGIFYLGALHWVTVQPPLVLPLT